MTYTRLQLRAVRRDAAATVLAHRARMPNHMQMSACACSVCAGGLRSWGQAGRH